MLSPLLDKPFSLLLEEQKGFLSVNKLLDGAIYSWKGLVSFLSDKSKIEEN